MKKQLKGFIIGFLAATILMSSTIFADNITTMIEVSLNSIKVMVNGKSINVNNILYNGTTYIPVRAVSEMLGKEVIWDGATDTAHINDQGYIANTDMEIVSINDEKITFEDYNVHLNLIKNQMQAYGQQVDGEAVKKMALEGIIQERIKIQKAAQMNIVISEEVIKEIEEQKNSYINAWGGKEQFDKNLSEIGFTEKSFEGFIGRQILERKLFEKIAGEDDQNEPSEEQIKDYYNENVDNYKKVTAKHILISTVDDNRAPLSEELQEAARVKAEEIYKKIKAGEDFDKLMKDNTEDPGLESNPDGYTFGSGEMIKEFEDAAFSMKKDEVSNPIKTDFGYHIIKVVDELQVLPIEEIKDQILQELMQEKQNAQQQKYQQNVDQWKTEAIIKINEEGLKQLKI